MIVLSFLTFSQWICINKGFWIDNIWKVTQSCVTLPRLRCVNIEKKKKKKKKNNHKTSCFRVFFFFFFFASTGHIYIPLIEKPRDHLDSDIVLLTRWEIFADHSGRRFCKFDFVQLYENKTCDTYLSRARDVDRRIRTVAVPVAHTKLHNSMH